MLVVGGVVGLPELDHAAAALSRRLLAGAVPLPVRRHAAGQAELSTATKHGTRSPGDGLRPGAGCSGRPMKGHDVFATWLESGARDPLRAARPKRHRLCDLH